MGAPLNSVSMPVNVGHPAPQREATSGGIVNLPLPAHRERSRKDAAELLRLAFPGRSIANAAIEAELASGISARTWERVGGRKRDCWHHEARWLAVMAINNGAPQRVVMRLMGAAE